MGIVRVLVASMLAAAILGCGSTADRGPVAAATLTPLSLSTEPPWHMKSTGVVTAVQSGSLWARVDFGNVNLQQPLNGALIALRVDDKTSFALKATRLADFKVGDHITFAFDPRTLSPQDGSYLATVIGLP
jgi:hypothetical protein